MTEEREEMNLRERVNLIQTMIAEGRRTTERWGWVFVLWGVAYYVAIGWSLWGNGAWAWPITMIAASILTCILAGRRTRVQPRTTVGRAIGSLWMGIGITMFVVLLSLGFSGRLTDAGLYVAIAAGMLGAANLASSLILRWKLQFACAVVWLATAAAACFLKNSQAMIAFVAAIFLCQIVFGFYGMARDSGQRRLRGAVHA